MYLKENSNFNFNYWFSNVKRLQLPYFDWPIPFFIRFIRKMPNLQKSFISGFMNLGQQTFCNFSQLSRLSLFIIMFAYVPSFLGYIARKSSIICYQQCSYISKIITIITFILANNCRNHASTFCLKFGEKTSVNNCATNK